jgi:hypothetical protein
MKKILLSVICLLFISFTACESGLITGSTPAETAVPDSGSVKIISNEPAAFTLTVSGISDTGLVLNPQKMDYQRELNINGLVPGNWTIFINYTDQSGKIMAYGRHRISIRRGRTSSVEFDLEKVTSQPGELLFIQEVLKPWLEPVFQEYHTPGFRFYGLFKRVTYYVLNGMLRSDIDLSSMENFFIRVDLEPQEIIKELIDILFFLERGDQAVDLVNELFSTFRDNMYYYFNVPVPFLVDAEISGMPDDLTLEEDDNYILTAGPANQGVAFIWYLNGNSTGEGQSFILTGTDCLAGNNILEMKITYRDIILGEEKLFFMKEEADTRILISDIPFVSTTLKTMVQSTGKTYADEVTGLDTIMSVPVNLSGIEYLINLESLTLIETGIDTIEEVSPLFGLEKLTSLILWEYPPVGNDVKIVLTNALPNCIISFE